MAFVSGVGEPACFKAIDGVYTVVDYQVGLSIEVYVFFFPMSKTVDCLCDNGGGWLSAVVTVRSGSS